MRASKKGAEIIDRFGVRLACIDDFAFRKGQRYGSVLVNIETRKVVDILNSREYEDVKKWLDGFPNLEIVSRDGSITYRKAIKDSNENIIQISDRFHLIKNLTEYAKSYIKRKIPVYIDLEMVSLQQFSSHELPKIKEKYRYTTKWELIMAIQKMRHDGYTISQISEVFRMGNRSIMAYLKVSPEHKVKYDAIPMVKKSKSVQKQEFKADAIQTIHSMLADGYSKQKIAESIGKCVRTVNRNLKADPSGRHGNAGSKRVRKLDPYQDEILILSAKGQSSLKIFNSIKKNGYTGSVSSIRAFLHKYSISAAATVNGSVLSMCRIERPTLISLLYKDISKVKDISHDHYTNIIKQYPELDQIFQMVKEFKALLMGANPNTLEIWIETVRSLDISEFNSFLIGVERDMSAIRNAIIFPYSNGLAEGTVNKIKVVKRIMYGRCGFLMLRRKVMLHNIN